MMRLIIILISIAAAFLGSTQTASFQCEYKTGGWGTLGTIYYCVVKNDAGITSLDTAQITDISGAHLAGQNDDNVVSFHDVGAGKIYYFPRGINKFFKNLKGIHIHKSGLKEIHQSDLKPFPKLSSLYLQHCQLEVLEENLFEFNPNLDYINLKSNKISHIDPNVFDKLTKLKTLYLESNNCISMNAENNPTEVQNIIKIVKSHCTNTDYSSLVQNVKSLETESKSLSLESLKEKLEILEAEVKNSKFENFVQDKLQSIKAVQVDKERQEELHKMIFWFRNSTKLESLETKVDDIAANVKDLMTQTGNETDCGSRQSLAGKFPKFDEKSTGFARSRANLKEVLLGSTNLKDTASTSTKAGTQDTKLNEKVENLDIKVEILEESLSNFKSFSYKKLDKMEIDEKFFRASIKKAMTSSFEDMERQIGELKMEIDRKFDEMDRKFEELLKIVKH